MATNELEMALTRNSVYLDIWMRHKGKTNKGGKTVLQIPLAIPNMQYLWAAASVKM